MGRGVSGQELPTEVAVRGLGLPNAIESVARTEEAGTLADTRDNLLATAVEGARLYIDVINDINAKRDKKDHIPTLRPGEYRYRAEDWLTDNLTSAATHLPVGENRPRLLIPRLTRAITTEEVLEAWGVASSGGLWPSSGRMEFLSSWSVNQLSGFDPEVDPDEVQFQVLPTDYDEERQGAVSGQSRRLEALQIEVPELRVAAIFDGVVLARRYKGQPRVWRDTYVRAIDFQPVTIRGDDCVPSASVDDAGYADVGVSTARNFNAARLLVRN